MVASMAESSETTTSATNNSRRWVERRAGAVANEVMEKSPSRSWGGITDAASCAVPAARRTDGYVLQGATPTSSRTLPDQQDFVGFRRNVWDAGGLTER